MKIHFSKMHGLGNDFVIIDAINQAIQLDTESIAQLANRHFGIGFDQLLLVEKPKNQQTDFYYRIFNADGQEVEQCGNGARCLARFVLDKGLTTKTSLKVETCNSALSLQINDDGYITANMGTPQISESQTIECNQTEMHFVPVNIGTPHAVTTVESLQTQVIKTVGEQLQKHPLFPKGVNVEFMKMMNPQEIQLRVYERGVGETLACGSGACAAIVAGIQQTVLQSPVTVNLPGGQLQIAWQGGDEAVYLTGPAETVFEGSFNKP